MDRYVSQLAEDLQAAEHKKIPAAVRNKKATMEEYFGIRQIAFPPDERLSEAQLNALNKAIISLLEAHRYMVNITAIKGLPANILYRYFVKQWVKEVYYAKDGLLGLEFCDDNPEECWLQEWCKKTWCEVDDDYTPPYYNGIYDDNGNKIDVHFLPVPELCLTCRSYMVDDWEENILCSMTRMDASMDDEDFICHAYKKRRKH